MSEQTPSYGFTNTYEPSPQAKALGTVIEALKYRPDTSGTFMENLMNPANLYVTTGMVKGPGWGAEALRRYRLLGGTPETLNKTFQMRAMPQDNRNYIVQNFRQATDIAAPPEDVGDILLGFPSLQARAMDQAGLIYERLARGGRPNTRFGTGPAQDITMHRPGEPTHESAAAGNAAYAAVSRQVARMLDTPGFYFKRAQDLPRVSAKEYNKAFPVLEDVTARSHPGRSLAQRLAESGNRLEQLRNAPVLQGDARFGPSYVDLYRGRDIEREQGLFNRLNERVQQRGRERHPGTPAAELREQIRRDLGLLPSEARFMERNARQRTRIMQEHSDMIDRSIDLNDAGDEAAANRMLDEAEAFARRHGLDAGGEEYSNFIIHGDDPR